MSFSDVCERTEIRPVGEPEKGGIARIGQGSFDIERTLPAWEPAPVPRAVTDYMGERVLPAGVGEGKGRFCERTDWNGNVWIEALEITNELRGSIDKGPSGGCYLTADWLIVLETR
jgi:hypothetical protein